MGWRMGNEGGATQTKKAVLTTDMYCLVFICLWMVLRSVKRELCTGGWRDLRTCKMEASIDQTTGGDRHDGTGL